jgi:hypothetical protein
VGRSRYGGSIDGGAVPWVFCRELSVCGIAWLFGSLRWIGRLIDCLFVLAGLTGWDIEEVLFRMCWIYLVSIC